MTDMMLSMELQRAELAQQVRRIRIDKGWSKEEAARNAGISAITWKRIEDGLNVHDGKLAAALRVLDLADHPPPASGADTSARDVDPSEDLVEFTVVGNFGVRAVVKGPVRDMDALQAAVSKLIGDMQIEESNVRTMP